MRTIFEGFIQSCMDDYIREHCIESMWLAPIVRFADANSAEISRLKSVVTESHFMPQDFLPEATVILSYFLPFRREIAEGNAKGRLASAQWAAAYLVTNEMAVYINHRLTVKIADMGHSAAVPENTGIISDQLLMSRWSQRHIAWLAGHGSFGINNMLISEKGCCGRYFSVVTSLPVTPDEPSRDERCLYKSKGKCGVCVKRCVSGALTADGFDRSKCYELCLENDRMHVGADVCGKCVVMLPCSFI